MPCVHASCLSPDKNCPSLFWSSGVPRELLAALAAGLLLSFGCASEAYEVHVRRAMVVSDCSLTAVCRVELGWPDSRTA